MVKDYKPLVSEQTNATTYFLCDLIKTQLPDL
jgi:hypothetical protein